MSQPNDSQTIDQLNSFLRGELSAVETYEQAISSLKGTEFRALLEQCEQSHRARANTLRMEIQRRGGEPSSSSGAWGVFAKAVEGTAAALGDKMAIDALEQGEDHGRDDYKQDIDKLDAAGRALVEKDILPEQLRTHDAVSALKKRLHSK